MVKIALFGYVLIALVMLYQFNVACSLYRFELRATHGKPRLYARSRRTGQIIGQVNNLWDLLSMGIK